MKLIKLKLDGFSMFPITKKWIQVKLEGVFIFTSKNLREKGRR
jgi:hypothetical protein